MTSLIEIMRAGNLIKKMNNENVEFTQRFSVITDNLKCNSPENSPKISKTEKEKEFINIPPNSPNNISERYSFKLKPRINSFFIHEELSKREKSNNSEYFNSLNRKSSPEGQKVVCSYQLKNECYFKSPKIVKAKHSMSIKEDAQKKKPKAILSSKKQANNIDVPKICNMQGMKRNININLLLDNVTKEKILHSSKSIVKSKKENFLSALKMFTEIKKRMHSSINIKINLDSRLRLSGMNFYNYNSLNPFRKSSGAELALSMC